LFIDGFLPEVKMIQSWFL